MTVPPWDVLAWAYDKRLTYQLAADIGLDIAGDLLRREAWTS